MRSFVTRQLKTHGGHLETSNVKCDAEECSNQGATRWIYCDVCGRCLHYGCACVKRPPKGAFMCPLCTQHYAWCSRHTFVTIYHNISWRHVFKCLATVTWLHMWMQTVCVLYIFYILVYCTMWMSNHLCMARHLKNSRQWCFSDVYLNV